MEKQEGIPGLARRGYVPEDERNFSPRSLPVLRTASRHILYLMEEGYDPGQAAVFVGNHFLLSDRQRLSILRSLATRRQRQERKEKEVTLSEISGKEVWIDGFNLIITLEVMACDSLLFEGMDGAIRDLAALRGTYRIIPQTREAARWMLSALKKAGTARANILLDEPVSNSGRLKILLAQVGEELGLPLDIQIQKGVDKALYGKELVISSDSVILDRCQSWVNLPRVCLGKREPIRVWEGGEEDEDFR